MLSGLTTIVSRDFYLDPPDLVAPRLLGKLLVRPGSAGQPKVGRIVEVEAYFGEADPAAHSFAGKTARNSVLFGPPGHAYVYFVYGMHFCLNVSCEPEGTAGSILLRALEPVCNLEATSGPGRLCKALGVTRERDNGADFTASSSELQIHDDNFAAGKILITPRVGITKNAERPARFLLAGNPFVSRPRS
jgi:DNA-3-methyladenine glycosylase